RLCVVYKKGGTANISSLQCAERRFFYGKLFYKNGGFSCRSGNKRTEDETMKHLKSEQVRQLFLDFFKEKGHRVEPSASLVPQNDPTLLWINSGVATLKKYFDGSVIPDNPRIVNAQKAIRTND